mmetsp:Transcript_7365/g.15993  ORF Transcript_7365/g.15993 Transcript_7365/m.15993 type:complete len:1114 (-) Transcript_7365:342-3683(-)
MGLTSFVVGLSVLLTQEVGAVSAARVNGLDAGALAVGRVHATLEKKSLRVPQQHAPVKPEVVLTQRQTIQGKTASFAKLRHLATSDSAICAEFAFLSLVGFGLYRYFQHQKAASKILAKKALSQAQLGCKTKDVVFGKCLSEAQSRPHAFAAEELAGMLMTDVGRPAGGHYKEGAGLSMDQAAEHLLLFGKNQLTPAVKEDIFLMLLKQVFGGLFNIMLWICVVCELALAFIFDGDDMLTPVILSMVIVASGTLQWWTELQAESMMQSLQAMQSTERVCCLRHDGVALAVTEEWVEPVDLVPGDIIQLEAGEKVPADLRIIFCTDGAEVDNAALTGESLPEPRLTTPEGPTLAIMEARNICFFGTTVVKGRMQGIVFRTGDHTFLGQIAAKMTTATRTRSSLEVQIEHFVHIIAFVALAVGLLSLVANVMSPVHRGIDKILGNAATAFFAQVPEGLLPTVTISLMIASRRMVKQKVLVRKIDAIETLGCVNVLCSDKTGTLTAGCMTATDIVTLCENEIHMCRCTADEWQTPVASATVLHLAQCGLLNNTCRVNPEGQLTGNPTEVAILEACCRVMGDDRQEYQEQNPRVFEIPFNSESKWMLTVHSVSPGVFRLILKGAPERVLALCKHAADQADICDLTDQRRGEINTALYRLMSGGRRVLCFAEMYLRDMPDDFDWKGTGPQDANFPMDGFAWLGLVGLEDPPKEGVKEAVAILDIAGCKTVMVTGDHPTTAQAIAERIGVLDSAEMEALPKEARDFTVITGAMLTEFVPEGDGFEGPEVTEEQLKFWRTAVQHARVFARVSPMHKRVIVRAYQQLGGAICAMTGDGVNDAPALKAAEVGVAMGIRGTEVAKEAADIVLLDDKFSAIVSAMGQGRLCSENLKKSIMYTLCSKIPQVMPTFAELLGVPTALTVAQVLLVDIGTDIWTAIAYACQPAENSLMRNKPRHPQKEHMVDGALLVYSYGYVGVMQMIACWCVFLSMPQMLALTEMGRHATSYSPMELQANYAGMASYYWTLVLGQVGAALATTTTRSSLFTYGLPNKWLNLCIVLEILLALLVVYWGPAQRLFKTESLTLHQALMGTGSFVAIVMVEECRKYFVRRSQKAKSQLLL